MPKRNKGIAFLMLGCFLLLMAGGWYVYNIVEDNHAGQQAAEILRQWDDAPHHAQPDQENDSSVIMVEGDAFCGKIIIDKLGMELPVYDEWNYARLKSAPCRYAGGIATNDIIIAGHNYKSHFASLNKLRIGDEVKFTDAYGELHLYEVRELVTLDGTAVSDMQSGDWDFTLFTCTKSGEQRVTVRCERK